MEKFDMASFGGRRTMVYSLTTVVVDTECLVGGVMGLGSCNGLFIGIIVHSG
jgi:hypothetical protein